MAKAQFHKNQRVYVKPVGTWALVERVVPHWAKGLDEPLRVYYDVGLGREFAADELQSEEPQADATNGASESWRIIRARNKWQPAEDCARQAAGQNCPRLKADFLDMERRWLFLARSYELTERVSAFSAKSNHRAKSH